MAEAKHIRTSIAQEGMSCSKAVFSPEDAQTPIARAYRVLAQMRRMLNLGEFSEEDFLISHECAWELADILCEMPTLRPIDLIFQLMARCDGGDPELLDEGDDVLAGCRRLVDEATCQASPASDPPATSSNLRALYAEWSELIGKQQRESFDRIAAIEDEAALIVPATVEEFALKILIADGGGDMNANTSLMALRDMASQMAARKPVVPLAPSALTVPRAVRGAETPS